MNYSIRPATAADLSQLIDLSRRTISACYHSFLGDAAVDGFLAEGLEPYVRDHLERCWVIEAEGRVVGFAVCKDGLIDLMMIDVDRHGQGWGGRLLAHCEEMLFQRYDELTLESFADNRQANGFYRRHGWRQVREYRDESAGAHKIVFHKARGAERERRP